MAKEKSKVELLDEKQKLQERASAITNGARTEQRMLNKDEEKELGEIVKVADNFGCGNFTHFTSHTP